MRRATIALSPLLLAACAYQEAGDPPPLPRLAEDPEQPALALLEHVLIGHFAEAGANVLTTCAALAPTALTPEQEKALMMRLVRLAPAARCLARKDGVVDTITGEDAQRVQVYDFACAGAALCSGWVARPGSPATRYALRFENGAWRFDGDPRWVAE